MSLDLGQLTLWQNITIAVLIGLTFIFSVVKVLIWPPYSKYFDGIWFTIHEPKLSVSSFIAISLTNSGSILGGPL